MCKKVFIADDSSTIRGVAEALLRQKGFEVYSASNGEATLKMINSIMPDVILLDYSMPELNGVEVCKAIRNRNQFEETPIIIMASQKDSERVTDFVESGADDTIIKPFTPRELSETVEKYINKKKEKPPKDNLETVSDSKPYEKERRRNDYLDDFEISVEELGTDKETPDIDSTLGSTTSSDLVELSGMDEDDAFDFTWSDFSLDVEELHEGADDSDYEKDNVGENAGIDPVQNTKQFDGFRAEKPQTFLTDKNQNDAPAEDNPHDYNWFINEMRKELSEPRREEVAVPKKVESYQKDKLPDTTSDPSKTSTQIPRDESVSGESLRATEKYEEFLSAFKDEVKEINELEEAANTSLSSEQSSENPERNSDTEQENETSAEDDPQPKSAAIYESYNGSEPSQNSEADEKSPPIDSERFTELLAERLAEKLADRILQQLHTIIDKSALSELIGSNLKDLEQKG